MILTAKNIQDLIRSDNIITRPVYDEINEWEEKVSFIEGNQFDLSIDRLFVRKHDAPVPFLGKYSRELPKLEELSPKFNEYRKEFTWELYPNTAYVGMTGEIITLPDNIKGFLDARSSDFILSIFPGVTCISPGFSGKIRFGIAAISPWEDLPLFEDVPIVTEIARGARIITVNLFMYNETGISYSGVWGGDKVTHEGIIRPH